MAGRANQARWHTAAVIVAAVAVLALVPLLRVSCLRAFDLAQREQAEFKVLFHIGLAGARYAYCEGHSPTSITDLEDAGIIAYKSESGHTLIGREEAILLDHDTARQVVFCFPEADSGACHTLRKDESGRPVVTLGDRLWFDGRRGRAQKRVSDAWQAALRYDTEDPLAVWIRDCEDRHDIPRR